MDELPDPARVTIRRRVEWAQTDAAGHHHWTAVLHWAEQAETVLHERLGIAERTFGHEPRVNASVDFTARLYFRDAVDVTIAVEHVGASSARYAFAVTRDGETAAHGTLTTVLVDPDTGRPSPWPDDMRAALTDGGDLDRLRCGARPAPRPAPAGPGGTRDGAAAP